MILDKKLKNAIKSIVKSNKVNSNIIMNITLNSYYKYHKTSNLHETILLNSKKEGNLLNPLTNTISSYIWEHMGSLFYYISLSLSDIHT